MSDILLKPRAVGAEDVTAHSLQICKFMHGFDINCDLLCLSLFFVIGTMVSALMQRLNNEVSIRTVNHFKPGLRL